MRKRRNVILGLTIASWLAIACGSGVGGLSTIDDGNDRPTDTREKPTGGREAPPISGREVPPTSGDNPGTQGGGGGGGSTCPPCDRKFDCLTGQRKTTITLKTVNGQCSAGEGITFDCAGRVLQNGTPIGTWSGSGSSYTVSVTSQGQSQTLVCSPSTTTTVPTGTGSGTATAPTTTATVPPPIDAGTKG